MNSVKSRSLLVSVILFGITYSTSTIAQNQPGKRASKVPMYTFSNTLEAQEAELKTNPLLQRFHAAREAQAGDPHRPIYHYVNPEGRLNDPNGLCFWQGRWHLFYQAYPPEDPRQHWGHVVSDDLIHWRDLPPALYPDPEDKCFSGSTYVEDDRVIAIYHGIAEGTMVATSSDPLLLNWKKVKGPRGGAVIPFEEPGEPKYPYRIFDPSIWKQGDYYYALTAGQKTEGPGGKPLRAEFLHRSKDLANWEYLHKFLEDDQYGLVGDDGACPYFWPIGNDGKYIMLHFSHMSGGKYMIGDYDTQRQKFVITDGGDFNHGPVGPGGTHAPSAFPDGKGGVIVIFNMNPGDNPPQGAARWNKWNQLFTLPRRLTLDASGKLNIEPTGDYTSLRRAHKRIENMNLKANHEIVLDNISGNAMEISAEIDPLNSPLIELNVLRSKNKEEFTRILLYPKSGYRIKDGPRKSKTPWVLHGAVSIDTSFSTTLPGINARVPETANVRFRSGEKLKLQIFVDKSIVEVFVNGRQCASVRVYPGRKDSTGVSLRAMGQNANVIALDAWQMENIYEAK
ncbi:MAG: glycoside hydrolase family 32 protein [Fuerstiella sp.]|nr:glycoside hydrolase family 32 protein [Fuerstiella sp.]MCP4855127.1 glycoside hydrolase family 32 protein [Fuerstiella sp.]